MNGVPIMVAMISVDQVITVARENADHELLTIGGRSTFRVTVDGGAPMFHPSSTRLPRAATNRARLEQIVDIYNKTGSLKIPDFSETGSQNLSYILRLVKMAAEAR